MAWWGKLLGGTLGFMMGGPLGALLGGTIGHQFDSGMAGASRMGIGDNERTPRRRFSPRPSR